MTNPTKLERIEQKFSGLPHLEIFSALGVPADVLPEVWGFIPQFLPDETESFIPQLNRNYAHGGGWFPLKGAKPSSGFAYQYPGDPEQQAYSALLNPTTGQLLVLHDYAFCSIWIWQGSEEPTLMRESILLGDTTNWKFGSVARID